VEKSKLETLFMYKFKRSGLLFVILVSLVFVATSEAAKVVTREEFFAALYDARGVESITDKDVKNPRKVDIKVVDVKKGGKKSEKNVSVKLKSASDKAEACFKLGYAGMPNTGIYKASAPATGQLSAPITRIEAIRFIIQSLGLSFEASVLSRIPSNFSDVSQLSAFERGCVAVAERMFPPFLDINDKVSKTFRPKDQLTKEELAKFIMNVRNAVNNLLLELTVSPAEGVTIKIHREGTFTGIPKWRINLHGFESEEEAKFVAAQIEEPEMTPHLSNFEWSLRGELLDDWRQVENTYNMLQTLDKQIAIVPSVTNAEGENQPRYWVLAVVHPDKCDIKVMTPLTGVATLSPLSQMTTDSDIPTLAVNAGYFSWTGKLRGNPVGTLVVNGELASAPYLRRTTMGWGKDMVPIFGYPKWSQEMKLPYSNNETLDKINLYSKNTFLTTYTSLYGIPTPIPGIAATEIIIKNGRCVGKAYGGTTVKKGDVILAAYGVKALLLDNIKPGDPINICFELTQDEGDYNDWGSITNAIQAGPMLLFGGYVSINPEGFENNFVNSRHPRTAVGIDSSGNWMIFVGDGRNGTHSIGYSLEETALIMQELGAEFVLNFDGGGSSEILVKGQLFNWPSEGRERAINNAIGVFKD
jgi:hypothetical protein